MDRKEILETAEKMVNGARQDDYGKPERSFEMIADLWSIYLKQRFPVTGVDLCQTTEGLSRRFIHGNLAPQDVAAMMILLKVARVAGGHGKSDNWIDIAGYAACGGELDKEPIKAKAAAPAKATQEKGVDWNRLAADLHRSVDAIAEMCRKAGGKE